MALGGVIGAYLRVGVAPISPGSPVEPHLYFEP